MKKPILIVSLILSAANVHADLITWVISSRITDIRTDMVGYADIGDIITLKYTFESATPDAEPLVTERASYENALSSAEVFLNSYHAQFEAVGYITILNDYSAGEDVYLVSSINTDTIIEGLPKYNGFGFVGFTFTYKDDDATMFNDTNLTLNPITIGYDTSSLTLHFRNPPLGNTGYGSAIIASDWISISGDLIFTDSFE